MESPTQKPDGPRQRRVRYRGTHPRRFAEKYKELNADKFAADIAHIVAKGKTPAGTHRPICVPEILGILAPKPGETGLDATLGFGGHARELLARLAPGGCLWGIDVDGAELARTEARLRAAGFSETAFKVKRINFAGIPKLLPLAGGGFDFILADLGVSSMQLDNPARGFTFKHAGPLDLRLNPERGQPAAALLRKISPPALEKLLRANADEPQAPALARAICRNRAGLATTTALAGVIRTTLAGMTPAIPDREITRSIRRTFQALRIAVNDEFSALDQFLRNLPLCLKPRGRAAVLSFHSGEDQRVSRFFQEGLDAGAYAAISREPVRPAAQECYDNPRAKSALLRWAIRAAPA